MINEEKKMLIKLDAHSSPLPKISVVIPLYNKAPHIARALDSVLAQTIQDFEIIILNDGSTDGGETIVSNYSDSRIHLLNQENQGVSITRNRGVGVAHAELVAFLDADDEWLPHFLETILQLKKKYPKAGMYATGYEKVKENIAIPKIFGDQKKDQLISSYIAAVNSNNGSEFIITSALAIPRNIFFEMGGFPEYAKRSEDRYLRARIALNYSVAYSSNIYTKYHLSIVNGSVNIPDYHTDPFSDYIDDLPLENTINRVDFQEITEFCDWGKLEVTRVNILHNHNAQQIRKYLHTITSPHCKHKKYLFILASYVPNNILICSYRNISKCLSHFRKHKY